MGGRVPGKTWNKRMKILVLLTRIGSVAIHSLLMALSTLNISAAE